ncbi:hypothetical protein H0X48_04975 [Candidatus Dependentiae bacterium]|nr:hypothetical protein [Candidatus Dependentiae bacterium]
MKKYILVSLLLTTGYSCSMSSLFNTAKYYALSAVGYYQEQFKEGLRNLDVDLVRYALKTGINPNDKVKLYSNTMPMAPIAFIVEECLQWKLQMSITHLRKKMVDQRHSLWTKQCRNPHLTLLTDIIQLLLDYGADINVLYKDMPLIDYLKAQVASYPKGIFNASTELTTMSTFLEGYRCCSQSISMLNPQDAFSKDSQKELFKTLTILSRLNPQGIQSEDFQQQLFNNLIMFGYRGLLKKALTAVVLPFDEVLRLKTLAWYYFTQIGDPQYVIINGMFKKYASLHYGQAGYKALGALSGKLQSAIPSLPKDIVNSIAHYAGFKKRA